MHAIWTRFNDALSEVVPIADPVIVFAAVMVIVLLAPVIMRRLHVPAPSLIGLILAGALVGEHGLNLLERGATVGLLGGAGLLYLMFMAGLSMDLGQFERTRARSVGFGLMSFFIPQLMGIAVGVYLLDFTPLQAILLGSIVGSHTLLAYPIVKRLGITRNRAVTVAMGGTILTDALALSVLAGVVAYHAAERGIGVAFWAQFAGLLVLFVAAVVLGLPSLGRWFFRTIRGRAELDFVFLLAVLFLTATFSQWVGLAPIVGAFLAGLTLNRLVPDTGPLMSRVQFVGEALFIPFFLLSVGMLVNVRVLAESAEVWTYAIAFTLLVIIGKGVAAKIAEVIFGFRASEGWTIAGLTIPQAAATLAVTLIGYEIEIFDAAVVNAIIILILISCLLGPWMVEKFGRDVALEEERAPLESAGGGPQRILVPLANPATADALMEIAFMLRSPNSPEPIYPLTVARDGPDVQAQVAAGEKLLSHAVVHAAAAGAPVVPITRVDYNVAHGVERAVRERRISTLIIGWNGQVTSRQAILGSILDQLLHSTQQTMVICRVSDAAPPLNTTQRVVALVPRFAERERGFGEAMGLVKTLTKEVGAKELVIATPQVAILRILDVAEKCPPQVDLTPLPISAVGVGGSGGSRGMIDAIEPEVHGDDLIVLISTRPGRMSWTNELARLPHRLSTTFVANNLLIVYSSEVEVQRPFDAARVRATPLLSANRVDVDLEPGEFGSMIERLLRPHFADRLHVLAKIHQELMTNLAQFAMAISPGVVLLHRHVARVTSPIVFVGVCRAGVAVPGVTESARVILVLLSPIDLPPEEHLRALAEIARMMGRPNVTDRLLVAKVPEDVIEALAPN